MGRVKSILADDALVERLLAKLAVLDEKVEDVRNLLCRRRKDHYGVEEFAELVGRTGYTVRRWISEGRLQAIRVSGTGPRGRLLVPRAELERLIASGNGGNIPAAV